MTMTRTTLKIHCGKMDPIPIIDLFFLLLTFALIGSSLVFHPGIQVRLPRAPSTELRGVPKIVITITRPRKKREPDAEQKPASGADTETVSAPEQRETDELLFFNDSHVQWDDLEQKLRKEVYDRRLAFARTATEQEKQSGHRSAPLLVLRADATVSYDRIVRVMALGRTLGLGVYLVTDPGAPRVTPPGPATAPLEGLAP